MPQCERCNKRRYADEIAAKVDGLYWGQLAVRCPGGNGWHLTINAS